MQLDRLLKGVEDKNERCRITRKYFDEMDKEEENKKKRDLMLIADIFEIPYSNYQPLIDLEEKKKRKIVAPQNRKPTKMIKIKREIDEKFNNQLKLEEDAPDGIPSLSSSGKLPQKKTHTKK
jgi:hypothetical protein